MGASHAAFFSADEEFQTPNYTVEQRLYPGSGRMMRTFRIVHDETGALVVAKYMYVTKDDEEKVQEHVKELRRIRDALQGEPHVAPFQMWKIDDYRTRSPGTLPIRPVQLLRPHVYTTLSDRLETRPFLAHVEKLWIFYQLLKALQAMHEKGVVHGFLNTENVGLTSWNFVVILDIASCKPQTSLPDDDPSEYLYYFQELNRRGGDTTPREKRCYLAPERFTSGDARTKTRPLTPAMDMFSAGCVAIETFLNGERALDLGDLMEYRAKGSFTPPLQQKLNKIESSSLRAACRHMLHVDPVERLSAKDYLERLESVMPASFEKVLHPFFRRAACEALLPDTRMALVASYYESMLANTVGARDTEGAQYFKRVLGSALCDLESSALRSTVVALPPDGEEKHSSEEERLLSETGALLQKLDFLKFDNYDEESLPDTPLQAQHGSQPTPLSMASASSLLIVLQLVLSTIRTVQRPFSKLVGLRLLEHCVRFSSDESKLQRILPVAVSLLNDQEPLVRATAVQVITSTMSTIRVFPPSDSKIFHQYVFKRMAHLISDQSLVVRVTFAGCIALLADTAHRFLDIRHAVRLYEAVGAGTGEVGSTHGSDGQTTPGGVFTDEAARLLGGSSFVADGMGPGRKDNAEQEPVSAFGTALIDDSYSTELAALQEVISRWVVQITTDQSQHSSPMKRSLLCDLTRLCNFFGRDGVMAFILPQVLAFLNDRRDWQLRAALFHRLHSVCYILGRAATEHFVLPCLETALVDGKDEVIDAALRCLTSLVEMGLTSRSILVTPPKLGEVHGDQNRDLLARYLPLLLFPSSNVRRSGIALVYSCLKAFGFPDGQVFLLPLLRPYLRFEPSSNVLMSPQGIEKCLVPAMSRDDLDQRLALLDASIDSPEREQWTSIGTERHDEPRSRLEQSATQSHDHRPVLGQKEAGSGAEYETDLKASLDMLVSRYIRLLAGGRSLASNYSSKYEQRRLGASIEGSTKLSQSTKFPKQNIAGTQRLCIPLWYSRLSERKSTSCAASAPYVVRSASAMGQVYGLSLLHSATTEIENDPLMGDENMDASFEHGTMCDEDCDKFLGSHETKIIEAACKGEWGADTMINPVIDDTALLLAKLRGLDVPVLPPNLATLRPKFGRVTLQEQAGSTEWKPKVDGIVASSSPTNGHNAATARLALSPNQSYFVSASHDGTCRVWELRHVDDCDGVLESSVEYRGHSDFANGRSSVTRVNDVTTIENSHSVASAGSDGAVHVWRVDMVSGRKKRQIEDDIGARHIEASKRRMETATVSGSSEIRRIDSSEGEVLAVAHFNSSSASLLMFATQSCVHSWDLRSSREPFKLEHQPDTGYQSSMAIGADHNWIVTGTSKGFLGVWDIRFQQVAKLWRHSSGSTVRRLATSVTSPSQIWGSKVHPNEENRPFLLAACGQNECSLFDLLSGSCRQSFKVSSPSKTGYATHANHPSKTILPVLNHVPITSGIARMSSELLIGGRSEPVGPHINAMVGSFGCGRSFLLTGGQDCIIRYWDFNNPGKCYAINSSGPHRQASFEKIDCGGSRQMLCQQPLNFRRSDVESSKLPRASHKGTVRPQCLNLDSIQDMKLIEYPMNGFVSCSRDGLILVWR